MIPPKAIGAGGFTCRLGLHRQQETDDGQGGHPLVYDDTPYARPWAKIETILARRYDEYQQMIPEQQHKITIRFRRGVVYTDQVRLGSRSFEQIAPPVNVDQKNAYLSLFCREVFSNEDNPES
ncbi:MAG: phage head closure protein [Negativicutes bacterium]|nr:phage head closure protein [Negativicutes bacterium]